MKGCKTDIFIFNKEGEKKKIKDCIVNNNFLYHRIDFFLVEDERFYYVCINNETQDLYSIWSKRREIDGEKISDREVTSYFRKEFDKNNISKELIEKFLKEPLKYTKLKIKRKRR